MTLYLFEVRSNTGGENEDSSGGTSPSDGVSWYIMLRWIGVDISERIILARSNPASCCQEMVPETSGPPIHVACCLKKVVEATVILWRDIPGS